MNSSTSWPPSSRKYSAMVRPARPTRRRAPGGSFIWPNTSAVLSMTPDSVISSPEVVALARALADAAEHRQAAVLRGDVVDQLLDDDGLAHAGAAEQADLAALDVRGEQVDDLDAGLEDLVGRVELLEVGRRPVDRPALGVVEAVLAVVDGLAHHVEEAAQRRLAHRHRDRLAGVDRPRRRGRGRRSSPWRRPAPCCRRGAAAPRRRARRLAVAVDRRSSARCRWPAARRGSARRPPAPMTCTMRPLFMSSTPQPGVDSTVSSAFRPVAGGRRARSQPSASAPATTSRISWVIDACRARFMPECAVVDHLVGALAGVAHGASCARPARWRSIRAARGRRRSRRSAAAALEDRRPRRARRGTSPAAARRPSV